MTIFIILSYALLAIVIAVLIHYGVPHDTRHMDWFAFALVAIYLIAVGSTYQFHIAVN